MGSTTPGSVYVTSRLRIGLGTFVALEAQASKNQVAETAIDSAWAALLTIERCMHPERPGSDLVKLAEVAPGATVPVHPWTWEVLQRCQELHSASAGAFDPSVAHGRAFQDLELLERGLVRVRSPMRLDLGGIAKGYAVDRALEALREAGCSAGLVNAGGDLATFGGQRRTILLDGAAGVCFELDNAALASSDTNASNRPAEHRGYYHGRDRHLAVSGKVTVTAAQAVWADALTKCALLLPPAPLAELLRRFDARMLVCIRASKVS